MKKNIKKAIGILLFIVLCVFFIYVSTFLPFFIQECFLIVVGVLLGYFIFSEFFI